MGSLKSIQNEFTKIPSLLPGTGSGSFGLGLALGLAALGAVDGLGVAGDLAVKENQRNKLTAN